MRTLCTYEKILNDWEANSRKWEKQYAYERGIVRSVPPMRIEVSVTEPVPDDWCDPG